MGKTKKKYVPKWRRRKNERPDEIIDAALQVFSKAGFAAANLNDIAKIAGITKPALYRYFVTKEDLFKAVAKKVAVPNFTFAETLATDCSMKELIPKLLKHAANSLSQEKNAAILKMVFNESNTFPELTRIWLENVAFPFIEHLTQLLRAAQKKGELIEGKPELMVFSLLGPMLSATLFQQTFHHLTKSVPDLHKLAEQHSRLLLAGLLKSQ